MCVGHSDWKPEELRDNTWITLPNDMAVCEDIGRCRIMYRCYTPKVSGVWLPQVHRPCAHNAVRGLLLRTLGRHPLPTDLGEQMFAQAADLVRKVLLGRMDTVEQWSLRRVVESYSVGRLRKRYEEAYKQILAEGLSEPGDARVDAFVKAEKMAGYKVYKPRIIMGRAPRYNLELASYLKPLEHALYPCFRGFGRQFLTHTRLIGKGLNGRERAALIRRKMQAHPGVVAFEVDCKSFESHVAHSHLVREHGIYNAVMRDPRLQKLLSWQLEFLGRFRNGVRFRASGCRASGDFNTGLGNTLIMCCLVLAAAPKGLKYDFLADGDNALLFVLESDLHHWQRELAPNFLTMGHELEIGDVARSVEECIFGQSKPINLGHEWNMVRNPFKVLSHAFANHRHFNEMRGGLRILKSVALCEAHLNKGVPILQEFSHAMLERLSSVKLPRAFEGENFEYQRAWQEVASGGFSVEKAHITDQTRLSFEKSWGVPPDEQRRIERESFRDIDIPSSWEQTPIDRAWAGIVDAWSPLLDATTAAWLEDRIGCV